MEFKEQIKLDGDDRVVFIVGLAWAGKTTIAQKLLEIYQRFKLIHTDDYIEHGFRDDLPIIANDFIC